LYGQTLQWNLVWLWYWRGDDFGPHRNRMYSTASLISNQSSSFWRFGIIVINLWSRLDVIESPGVNVWATHICQIHRFYFFALSTSWVFWCKLMLLKVFFVEVLNLFWGELRKTISRFIINMWIKYLFVKWEFIDIFHWAWMIKTFDCLSACFLNFTFWHHSKLWTCLFIQF